MWMLGVVELWVLEHYRMIQSTWYSNDDDEEGWNSDVSILGRMQKYGVFVFGYIIEYLDN